MSKLSIHQINSEELSLEIVESILAKRRKLVLSDESRAKVHRCRAYLEQKIGMDNPVVYGINTGFGSLCNIRISDGDLAALQLNLVRSHAAGSGRTIEPELVKIILLLKIQSLSYGHSGVRVEIIERLIEFYNRDILPVIFEFGSLGASGDLAPLAHLSLPLVGEGEVWYKGRRQPTGVVLKALGIEPLQFASKEALALLNGTQFSTAFAVWSLHRAKKLLHTAQLNVAIGADAFHCSKSPYLAPIHQVRPHKGQMKVAQQILQLLEGSEIANSPKTTVQDPYSFRCVPQVHGASADVIAHVTQVVTTEMNAVTDNPNIFPEEDLILSGGNFHAQPIALALDYLCIALSELGSISERRIYQLISGQRQLPPFLTANAGLHSGLMIAQYTAAAIVSKNKTLCTPSSADSIVSCNGQEDHVSMAANAAVKTKELIDNLEQILAIEYMTANQALDFRSPAKSSPIIEELRTGYRVVVKHLHEDRIIHYDMTQTITFLRESVYHEMKKVLD